MNRETTLIVIGLILALILGFLTARSSSRRDKIYAGVLAYIFHYLGAVCIVSVLLSVLINILLHSGFVRTFLWAAGLVGVGFLNLLLFAVIEHPVRSIKKPKEVAVWTEKEARTSGL